MSKSILPDRHLDDYNTDFCSDKLVHGIIHIYVILKLHMQPLQKIIYLERQHVYEGKKSVKKQFAGINLQGYHVSMQKCQLRSIALIRQASHIVLKI